VVAVSLPAAVRIPVMTAGTYALLDWFLPDLAAALVDPQPLSVVAAAVLVAGAVFLGEIAPQLLEG